MADYFDSQKNARENIEKIQKAIDKRDFKNDARTSHDERMKAYAAIFALRNSVQSIRGNKESLNKAVDPMVFQANQDQLLKSQNFYDFVVGQGKNKMISGLRSGHGGSMEDAFQEYLMDVEKLDPQPNRYMPKDAPKRIENLQRKLNGITNPKSERAIGIYAEIFRTRRAKGVTHTLLANSKLQGPIDSDAFAQAPDLSGNETFKEMINKKGAEFKGLMAKGHGGEAENFFKDYVKEANYIDRNMPLDYLPTSLERIEALQKKVKANSFNSLSEDQQDALYLEILATRFSAGAQRGKKSSLDSPMYPNEMHNWLDYFKQHPMYKDFLHSNKAEIKEAVLAGHGGALVDKFKDYVKNMDVIPEDAPEEHMPTAKERIEILQKKLSSTTDPDKIKLYTTEIMATRLAAGAIRGKEESLEKPLNPAELAKQRNALQKSTMLEDMLAADPVAAKTAALKGHGGALDDRFKANILASNHIVEGTPSAYMPNAKERIEVLQKKIEANQKVYGIATDNRNLLTELTATRMAAGSVRGSKKTLKTTFDSEKFSQSYNSLSNCSAWKSFSAGSQQNLTNYAINGHGGLLEDEYTRHVADLTAQQLVVPAGVDKRHAPQPNDVLKKIQTDLKGYANKAPNFYTNPQNQEAIKNKVAAAMYLTNADAKYSDAEKRKAMQHDAMSQGIHELKNNSQFKNMITGVGVKEAARLTAESKTGIFRKYNQYQPAPAPVQNPNPQLNNNDPNLANNLNQNNLNQNNLNQNNLNQNNLNQNNLNQNNLNQNNLNQNNLNQNNLNQNNLNQNNLNQNNLNQNNLNQNNLNQNNLNQNNLNQNNLNQNNMNQNNVNQDPNAQVNNVPVIGP
ncbi:MAG: hypothetical protein J6P72_10395 [Firmicutes bacterium]|nr:hypothetical protein [Bacillota bacterium]